MSVTFIRAEQAKYVWVDSSRSGQKREGKKNPARHVTRFLGPRQQLLNLE